VNPLPIDKSIAQRCAVLGLGFDKTDIGEDVKSTLAAVEKFNMDNPILDLGNSGTGMRLITGYLAGMGKNCTLIGDSSLSNRPMKRIADPLVAWGATISLRDNSFPPIKIESSALNSDFKYDLKIPSAQIKSCLLLAALASKTKIEIIENTKSRDHTELLLEECEADIKRFDNKIILDGRKAIKTKFIDIPRDFSSAAYLIAANIISKVDNKIEQTGLNKTRTAFLEVVQEMGVNIEIQNYSVKSHEPRGDINVLSSSNLKGVDIRGEIIPNIIDELPLLAVLATFAEGKTTVRDARELRYKESDRISLLLKNLRKFNPNIGITEFEDGFEIIPAEQSFDGPVEIETGGDHRIAMSFMIASLKSKKNIKFDDMECVETSFPGFFELIRKWYQ
tara:strand:- start:1822 stop:2997 length:1176 start_codon:yes stop_codon:yes gene_type:complete